jgi:nucleoside-diphosphate-sugar epimerase
MNILVTGGAGYKGVKLTGKLLEKGYRVTVVDNFMYGFEPVLHLVERPGLTIIRRDIRNGVEHLHAYDVIFHLAGISGFPACAANPHSAQLINVDATRNLVHSLSPNQILINASTTSLYGKKGITCDEDTPVEPVSTYAITKYEAEKIISEKPQAINLRFATVFGVSPRMRMDLMVNDFTYKALKEGALVLFDSFAKRTFIHIDDAIDAYIFSLENYDRLKGQIFNVGGNGLNYSKKEIARIIRNKIEYNIIDSEIKDRDLRHYIVSFDKFEKLGFTPRRSLEQGIDELIRLFTFYEYYSHFKTI